MSSQHALYVLLFRVLAVNSDWFQILQSYMLLLYSHPFLCRSWWKCVSAQLGTYSASRECISTHVAHSLGNFRIIPFLSIVEQAATSILMKVFPKHTHNLVSAGRVRGTLAYCLLNGMSFCAIFSCAYGMRLLTEETIRAGWAWPP